MVLRSRIVLLGIPPSLFVVVTAVGSMQQRRRYPRV